MKIETKLQLQEYTRLMLYLTYKNSSILFITVAGVLSVFIMLGLLLAHSLSTNYLAVFSAIILVALLMPFLVCRGSKRSFLSNGRLQEKIIYEFTEEHITITGETFKSEMDWTKIYKITELKNWVLIYQNMNVVNIIPKNVFGNQLNDFRQLVKSKPIKAKLKSGR